MPQSFSDMTQALTVTGKLFRINWSLIALLCGLAGIGVMSLYSVADGNLAPWAERHAVRFILCLGLLLIIAMLPLRLWAALAYPFFALALALLALVPVIGTEALGAKRWLQFGGFSLQPSELMKVALVVALARYYQWLPANRISHPLWVAIPLIVIAAPVALTLKQPDLGTATLFAIVGLGVMFIVGVSWLYFIAGAVAVAVLLPLILMRLHDYQRRRVEIFLDPDLDPLGAGYHISQSKIALGSGGLSGRGYMQGTQSTLDFLPEKHTDFIFTMFAEEWGFVGAAGLVGLYALLVLVLLTMALRCRSQFARLLCAGAGLVVFVYAAINMAMVTGLAPVVGVPLPLVSYGGTSMIAMMVTLGLALCGSVNRSLTIRRRDWRAFL